MRFPLPAILLLILSCFDLSVSAVPGETPFLRPDPGIPDIEDIYGVVFRDLDGDTRPDLYLVGFRSLNRLLISGPGSMFTDRTIVSGLGGDLQARGIRNLELGALAADLDNDGDADLILSGWTGTTRYFRNEGGLRFSDVTSLLRLADSLDANDCAAADVNRDGYLDLFFTDEHHSSRLLLNDRYGGFRDRTDEWGLRDNGVSQGAVFADVDRDGDPDLYVCNWFGPDRFYRNEGGRFIAVSPDLSELGEPANTNSATFGDVDQDGDPDLLVAHRDGVNSLYLNETPSGSRVWTFRRSQAFASVPATRTYGLVLLDADMDGDLDLAEINLGPNRFFFNRGDGVLEPVPRNPDPAHRFEESPGYSTGSAVADLEGDGMPDLVVANKDTFCVLLRNTGRPGSGISLQIEGVRSNRDAVGARVEVWYSAAAAAPAERAAVREVAVDQGYLSGRDPRLWIGLKRAGPVNVTVTFPSGRRVQRNGLEPGRSCRIAEYSGAARVFFRSLQALRRRTHEARFWVRMLLILSVSSLTGFWIRFSIHRYRWSGSTAALYLGAVSALAFAVVLLLPDITLVRRLLAVNGLAGLMIVSVTAYSERIHRLRGIRETYRSLLIQLGRDMLQFHDDLQLARQVAGHLAAYSGFRQCCVFLREEEEDVWSRRICSPQTGADKALPPFPGPGLVKRLIREGLAEVRPEDDPFVSASGTPRYLISAARQDRLRAIITLDSGGRPVLNQKDDRAVFCSLGRQIALALENNAYIRRSNEMTQQLTEARVREEYTAMLERKNRDLDEKNRELRRLFNDLKETESQLIHSEKMASLGQLVAGLSHELNNPIGFIYANTRQIQTLLQDIRRSLESGGSRNLKDPETGERFRDLDRLIRDMVTGSRHVKTLVDNLRRFSHLDRAQWQRCDIHEGLESCLILLRPLLAGRITVEKTFRSQGWVECNMGQINQVFMNVLSNAAQAMEEQGTLFIRTRDEGSWTVVEMEDTGEGIPESVLPHIFDPFFTTRDVGKGMGLGLSIAHTIMEQHGGRITAENVQGSGCLFRIWLPAGPAEEETPDA